MTCIIMKIQEDVSQASLQELAGLDGNKLRDIAATAIRSHLSGMRYRPTIDDPALKRKAGVFVTIRNKGELRGCIGFIYPSYEIWDATRKAAVLAATEDPRFRPVTKAEIDSLDIEVTVLGPIEPLKTKEISSIKLGEEGLMVVSPVGSGLLLPQVATENNFTAVEFLEATCEKAGLSRDAWQDPSVSVYRFRALIF